MTTLAKEKRQTAGFGKRLRELRTAAGLTQQQVADALGMLATNITRLESGGRQPSWETVVKLAKALGTTPDAFLPHDE